MGNESSRPSAAGAAEVASPRLPPSAGKGGVGGAAPPASTAASNIVHFDHAFNAVLVAHQPEGFVEARQKEALEGEADDWEITVNFRSESVQLVETVGVALTEHTLLELSFADIYVLEWDHSTSCVKVSNRIRLPPEPGEKRGKKETRYVIIKVENSLDLEAEVRLRLKGLASRMRDAPAPAFAYVGMFAGNTKPKPFQRKRPNLSKHPASKLPPLAKMRRRAMEFHRGLGKPVDDVQSKRKLLAVQHMFEGRNSFRVRRAQGADEVEARYDEDALLAVDYSGVCFFPKPNDPPIPITFTDMHEWSLVTDSHHAGGDGLEIVRVDGRTYFFAFPHVIYVKQCMEFFWNQYRLSVGRAVRPSSIHGRALEIVYTLQGPVPAPEPTIGNVEPVDQTGQTVVQGRKLGGGKRASVLSSMPPRELPEVRSHWTKVALHQGWLLKKGGATKSWQKRYFILYRTSMGHFLVYYSDFRDLPLFTKINAHRNMIDLCRVTFIRPVSKNPETPENAFAFDVVTIEREWTICAQSQAEMQLWLKVITRAVDEDVAIVPDYELDFPVKVRTDPTGQLPEEAPTHLKVSSSGVSVQSYVDGEEKEWFFWCYTDFYKWSLLQQHGKMALLINVFADESFNQRQEFVFRTKDASDLATTIEYYIEKFMSVMNILAEEDPAADSSSSSSNASGDRGATDSKEAAAGEGKREGSQGSNGRPGSGLNRQGSDRGPQTGQLIGLGEDDVFGTNDAEQAERHSWASEGDGEGDEKADAAAARDDGSDNGDMPGAGEPFSPRLLDLSEDVPQVTAAGVAAKSTSPEADDLFDADPFAPGAFQFGGSSAPGTATAATTTNAAVPATVDPFSGADPFATDAATAVPPPAPTVAAGGAPDPFDVSGSASVAVDSSAAVVAPTAANPFDDAPALVVPAATAAPAAGDPFETDKFAFGGAATAAVAPPAVPAGPIKHEYSPDEQFAMRAMFNAVLANNTGQLLNIGALAVFMRTEYRGSQGRVTFLYRNAGVSDVTNLHVQLTNLDPHIRYQLGAAPTSVPVSGEAQQILMVECMQPFDSNPVLTLEYTETLGGHRIFEVQVPIVQLSFNEPLAVASSDFLAKWQALSAGGQEKQEIIHASKPFMPAAIRQQMTQAARIGEVQGLDASEYIFSGASTLRTGALAADGQKINIGCLVRLEMNVQTSAFRLTLRTVHPTATETLMAQLRQLLTG